MPQQEFILIRKMIENEKNAKKSLLIFDSVRSDRTINEGNLRKRVSPNAAPKSFDRLINRLIDKIGDYSLTENVVQSNYGFDREILLVEYNGPNIQDRCLS